MNAPINQQRRQFLKVVGISGVGFAIGPISLSAHADGHSDGLKALNDFVKVSKDNRITVVVKHLDKGQGVTTGLTAIVADEMDADWGQMDWEFAPADASKYNNLFWGPFQGTGGSTAVANSWEQLRKAGAGAKQMLLATAAQAWGVEVSALRVSKGVVTGPGGKSTTYGALAEAAATKPVPAELSLKTPEQFTIIGTDIPRIDSPEKSTGKAEYTIDVRLPGMLYAVTQHPPKFGATVKSVDDSDAKKVPGVKSVVQTPRGVSVLAEDTWSAIQGRKALKVVWDESAAEQRGSTELWQEYRQLLATDGSDVRADGNVGEAFSAADDKLEMTFEFPFVAHATMEPMNCVVDLKENSCDVYTGSQGPTGDLMVTEQITGLSQDKITIHTKFAGGSFGRRVNPSSDFVMEAVLIAKAINGSAPVSLQWTREDDMKAGYYRPMSAHKMQASVKGGELTGWDHRIVSQSLLRGTAFEAMIQGPIDPSLVEGARTLPYAIENLRVNAHEHVSKITTLWWRSVGHSFNGFSTEVFFDEVARKLGKDPVELRLALLKDHPRHAGVLKLAAEKANWSSPLPANKGRGVALHESFGSFVAHVAEVTVNDDGSYKVDKITTAVDCGIAITPDVIKAQMEGGIGYGLSAAKGEKITLTNGKVDQSNFYDYFPMRIHEMPDVDVHIVTSGERPTGVGEPGTPPAAPAVANALRKFLKEPITTLPWGDKLDLA